MLSVADAPTLAGFKARKGAGLPGGADLDADAGTGVVAEVVEELPVSLPDQVADHLPARHRVVQAVLWQRRERLGS